MQSPKKPLLRRIFNRVLHSLARSCPGAMTLRPFLHKLRGVKIGRSVWIGDDVYLENEYPEMVEIQEGSVLSLRSMIIAHTRGHGRIIIEHHACIGPCAVVICEAGRTLRIGAGAVVSTGSIVTSSVLAQTLIAPPRSSAVAKATVPFALASSMEEFIGGLKPLRKHSSAVKPPGDGDRA